MAHQEQLLTALAEIASATEHSDCLRRIATQARLLFPASRPEVRLGGEASVTAARRAPLRARGRLLGHLVLVGDLDGSADDSAALSAFAEHAALALDNAQLLDEHAHRARRDSLTGLRNYREFNETLAAAIADANGVEPAPVSLVVLDLDRLKEVNDRGGHAAGDRLLRAAAAALSAVCRAEDAAFRVGGDEFALILPGATRGQASLVAERAANAISSLAGSGGASWGVASRPQDGVTRDQLISAADAAMYRRKGQPNATAVLDRGHARSRLAVASRLATRLTSLADAQAIAEAVVAELHRAFGYYLAVIHRLHEDGVLRVVAGAGPLAETDSEFLAWEQPIHLGVNGRVARTGEMTIIHDTRLEPDYLASDPREDPGSELSVPIIVDNRVWGVLNLEQIATHGFDDDDVLLAEAVVAQIGAALHRCSLLDELERSFATTLGALCDALESRDVYTARHSDQVVSLAVSLAERLELDSRRRQQLAYCARLHDIGKIGVRTELLNKRGPLTPAEYTEIKEHSIIGAQLLSTIPLLAEVSPLVRAVHERWDGTGYPDGLAGPAIPLEARIVAVCDAWDAMIADRPYRRALAVEVALRELRRCAGSQFDPKVVSAFTELRDAVSEAVS